MMVSVKRGKNGNDHWPSLVTHSMVKLQQENA